MNRKVPRKYQIYPIYSTPIQQNIYTMLHAVCSPKSSQFQQIHTLYFPWHCTVHFTCSEMNLFTSFHVKVYAVASNVWFKLQLPDLTNLCNNRKKQNKYIRNLNPKTIHPLIKQLCLCVCVCVCVCVSVCLCVYVRLYLYICIYILFVCTHVCVCKRVCTYIYNYIHDIIQ